MNYSGLLMTFVLSLSLAGSSCKKTETTEPSGLTVVLKKPRTSFVFGQPIHLNVIFCNNLERTITVPGIHPEGLGCFGRMTTATALKLDEAKSNARCVRAGSSRQLITSWVSVTRISGTANDSADVIWDSQSETHSRDPAVLHPGDSSQYSFDLLDTPESGTINAPGRFNVSITYKVKTKSSPGFVADESEWSGEIHSEAMPITVVSE